MIDRKIEIELRGRKFVCQHYTNDHAIFFGTLLMSMEEIAVFVEEEDPDKAFKMMDKRQREEIAAVKAEFAHLSEEDIEKEVLERFKKSAAGRFTVRMNQDRDPTNNNKPGLRARVGQRLREVFPTIPKSWVSEDGINLDLEEQIETIVVPMYVYLNRSDTQSSSEAPKVEPAPPVPVVPPAILLPEIQQEIKPVANAGITLSADQLSELPPELLARLGVK